MEVSTIGLDLAKNVFQVHGADAAGSVIFRKRLRRDKVLAFVAVQPICLVAMEACGGAHHWARQIAQMGHSVRLIPPAYVKPFVKRQKNDAADAEAICEAAQRPTMRFVSVKSEEAQASAVAYVEDDLITSISKNFLLLRKASTTGIGVTFFGPITTFVISVFSSSPFR
ncbi:transposase [Phyllobacterium myrsinacearum]|uniref:Transposase n=1 Tax=Phyllobacterium myrsinacearum TaxID=28101 RepID=A0A839EQC4_9HYPH|nr:transposase [Phyllobacterium myrsinacearum]